MLGTLAALGLAPRRAVGDRTGRDLQRDRLADQLGDRRLQPVAVTALAQRLALDPQHAAQAARTGLDGDALRLPGQLAHQAVDQGTLAQALEQIAPAGDQRVVEHLVPLHRARAQRRGRGRRCSHRRWRYGLVLWQCRGRCVLVGGRDVVPAGRLVLPRRHRGAGSRGPRRCRHGRSGRCRRQGLRLDRHAGSRLQRPAQLARDTRHFLRCGFRRRDGRRCRQGGRCRRGNRRSASHRRGRRGGRRCHLGGQLDPARRGALRPEGQQAQQHHHQAAVFVGRQGELGAAVQRDAVEQLRLVRVEQRRQRMHGGGLGVGRIERGRHRLRQRHLLGQRGQILERAGGRQTQAPQLVDRTHQRRTVSGAQRLHDAHDMAAIDRAQHLPHRRLLQRAAAEGDGLVGQRQRVAHRAARGARELAQGARLGLDAFGLQHGAEVALHRLGRHRAQVELQAAAQHRDRHLLRIGGGQHELQVLGRLLERLQHRVEGGRREHVHLVDHVDLEAPGHRLVDRLVEQLADLVDAAVGGGVQLDIVDMAAGIDVAAGVADAAGLGGDAALPVRTGAVQALGKDARDGRLADAAGAGEQVGMVQSLAGQRVAQGLHDMLLPHHLGEAARPVLAGKDDIGHGGGL